MRMTQGKFRKRLMVGGVLLAGSAAGFGVMSAAHAETVSRISGTGATASAAVGDALARCAAEGGAGGGELDSHQNSDGSWQVTIECVHK